MSAAYCYRSVAYYYESAAYYDKSAAYYYRSATMQCIDSRLQVFLQNVVCLLSKTSSTYEAEARR